MQQIFTVKNLFEVLITEKYKMQVNASNLKKMI